MEVSKGFTTHREDTDAFSLFLRKSNNDQSFCINLFGEYRPKSPHQKPSRFRIENERNTEMKNEKRNNATLDHMVDNKNSDR